MQPKEFCHYHGFTISTELKNNGKFLIHIQDPKRLLYKSGERRGKQDVHPAIIEQWKTKVYNQLMDKILDKLYA